MLPPGSRYDIAWGTYGTRGSGGYIKKVEEVMVEAHAEPLDVQEFAGTGVSPGSLDQR